MLNVFNPVGSVLLSVTSTTGNVALPGSIASGNKPTVRLVNAGSGAVFVAFGGSGVTAASDGTSMIIPAGVVELFEPPTGATHIAGITATSTASLYITRGEGV